MNKKRVFTILLSAFLVTNSVPSITFAEASSVMVNEVSKSNPIAEKSISKLGMTATATSFQSGEDASKALDSNLNTMWHTPWDGSAVLPQSLTVSLGGTYEVSSLRVTPRQSGDNGKIQQYEIYAGDELVASGTWDTSATSKTVRFDKPVTTDTLTVKAIKAVGGFVSIAEVDVYQKVGEVEKVVSSENKRIANGVGGNLNSELDKVKNLEEATIIARFDLNKTGIQSILGISNSSQDDHHFNLWTDGSQVGYEIRNAAGNTNGKVTTKLNAGINTIAFKVEKNVGYTIYLNGKAILTTPAATTKFLKDIPSLNTMDIGKTDRAGSANEYLFTGDVDFLEIYNKPISEDYILEKTIETAGKELPLPDDVYKSDVKQLFKAGDLNSRNFRIPSIFTTKDGTVIAATDVRNNHNGDSPANIDAGVIISKDGGKTWTDQKRVIDYPGNASVIDASMLQDEETGKVFLFITAFPENYGFPNTQRGTGFETIDGEVCMLLFDGAGNEGQKGNGNKYHIKPGGKVYTAAGEETAYTVDANNNLYENGVKVSNTFLPSSPLKAYGTAYLTIIESGDEGATWSEPKIVSGGIKKDWMKFIGTGPGRGIQIKNGEHAGRLVFPLYYTNSNNFQSSATMYSDDNGQTWTLGESPNDSRAGHNEDSDTISSGNQLTEAQVVEMPDGQLKMFMRNTGVSGGYVKIATSFDGAETWEAEVVQETALREPYCQMSVINYSQDIDGKPALIFSNPNASNRTNGTVRIGLIEEDGQYENGRTKYNIDWKYSQVIKEGYYSYSCLTEMPNGNIGVYYENESVSMDFVDINLNYIKTDLLANAPAAKISNVTSIDNVDGYKAGDKIKINVALDQAVSLIGNKELTGIVGDKEFPLTVVENNKAKNIILEGNLPSDIVAGEYNFVIKAKNDLDIINVIGKKTDLSNNTETNLSILVKGNEVVSNGKTTITTPETIKVEDVFDIKLGVNELKEGLEAYAGEFVLNYNSDVFDFKAVKGINEKVYATAQEIAPGEVKIIVASLGLPISNASDLINITLEARKEAVDETIAVTSSMIGDGEGNIHELELTDKKVNVEKKDVTPEEIVVSKINNLKSSEVTDSSVKLSWDVPNNTVGLTEYVIYKDGKILATIPADSTEHNVTGLKSNTIYGFKVTAKYSNNQESKPTSLNIRTQK
ncbi:sialidase domain-containing protein [Clostridium sp.]|uniref:sialidase domain-containing protein n=1 Tax=Clostridium sp. TaxID=1506 RepID=UPI003F331E1D